MERGRHRHADADHERRHDGAGEDHQAGIRDGEPERREHVEQQTGETDAEAEAHERPREPDDQRLRHHRSDDLSPGTADRPQQTELPGALRDEDREGVEDDEAADEQPDAGEAEQRGVEEAEGLLDGLGGLTDDFGRAQHLDVVERLPDRPFHRAQVRAAFRDDVDRVEPVLAELALRGCEVERGEGQRAEVGALTKREDADEPKVPSWPEQQHADVVSDPVPEAARRRVVHRNLAVAPRRVAGRDAQRTDTGGRAPRDADGRCAEAPDGLTVLVDDLRIPLHEAVGGGDSGDPAHGVDRRLGELRTVAILTFSVERALVAHDEIDADAGLREGNVERASEGVGEHVDAGDERDAEHDRERGEREPDLPGGNALDGGPPHRPHCGPTVSAPASRSDSPTRPDLPGRNRGTGP